MSQNSQLDSIDILHRIHWHNGTPSVISVEGIFQGMCSVHGSFYRVLWASVLYRVLWASVLYIRSPVISSRSESSVPHPSRTGWHIAPWWCTSSFSLLGWYDHFQTASRDRTAPNSTNHTLEIFKAKAKGKHNLEKPYSKWKLQEDSRKSKTTRKYMRIHRPQEPL